MRDAVTGVDIPGFTLAFGFGIINIIMLIVYYICAGLILKEKGGV